MYHVSNNKFQISNIYSMYQISYIMYQISYIMYHIPFIKNHFIIYHIPSIRIISHPFTRYTSAGMAMYVSTKHTLYLLCKAPLDPFRGNFPWYGTLKMLASVILLAFPTLTFLDWSVFLLETPSLFLAGLICCLFVRLVCSVVFTFSFLSFSSPLLLFSALGVDSFELVSSSRHREKKIKKLLYSE